MFIIFKNGININLLIIVMIQTNKHYLKSVIRNKQLKYTNKLVLKRTNGQLNVFL